MLGSLIGLCFIAGCLLFVLSLPLAAFGFGRTLRRLALFSFLLALAPAVACGLLQQGGASAGGGSGGDADTFGVMGGLVVLSAIAYVILKVRARFFRPQRDAWSDYVGQRSAGKRVVDDREHARPDERFPL